MPRGARLAFPNAFYHVFNRGINKQPIFINDQDYWFFLEKLRQLQSKYDHSVYAYCLMPNHFHLSLRTRKVSVSKIMSSLATSYSIYFNRTYGHFGSIFQNRFKSILIENDHYFLALARYIYLNPVKSSLVSDPLDYPYSSIREALKKEPLKILNQDQADLISQTPKGIAGFKEFIYGGIKEEMPEIKRLFEKEEAVFGSEAFNTRSQKKYYRRKNA